MSSQKNHSDKAFSWYKFGLPRALYLTAWIALSIIILFYIIDCAWWLSETRWNWTPATINLQLCLLFIVLALIIVKARTRKHKLVAVFLASVVSMLSLLTIYSDIYTVFPDFPAIESSVRSSNILNFIWDPVVRMPLFTSISFLMFSMIILLIAYRRVHVAHFLNILVILLCYFFLISYLLRIYTAGQHILPVSLNASIMLTCIAILIFVMYPDTWFMRVFTSGSSGTIIARQMLFPLIIVPIIIGWLMLRINNNKFFVFEESVVLVAVAYTVFFLVIAWFSARSVDKVDRARMAADAETQKAKSRLELLSGISVKLLVSDNPQALVNEICNEVKDYLNCQMFFNYLADEDSGNLFLNAWGGITEQSAHAIGKIDKKSTICGCVASKGERIICESIQQNTDNRADLVRSLGMRAYACHPLLSNDKVIGTLSFGTSIRDQFADEELSLMKVVTDQVAIAMGRILHQKQLRESEDRFRTIAESLPVLFAIIRRSDSILLFTNEAYDKAFGYEHEQVIGRKAEEMYDNQADRIEIVKRLQREGYINGLETKVRRADGTTFWIMAFIRSIVFEGEPCFLSALVNIDERKKEQQELMRLNRKLNALGKSSHVMMHTTNEFNYLRDVCRIVTEELGFLMVWIGYARDDESKTVEPVAYYGLDKGYVTGMNITWDESERGRGPTGTAIRTGKPAICRNMLTDPAFAPWREQAVKRGYASSLVLPLNADGKTFGAMSIYSREPDSFDDEDLAILTSLANDMAYGIMHLRLTQNERQAAAAIKESEEKFRLLFERMAEALAFHEIILDEHGLPVDYRFLSVNPSFEKQTGLKPGEILGKTAKQVLPNLDYELINTYGNVALTGVTTDFETYSADLDSYFRVNAFCPKKGFFACIFENITSRVQSEKELRNAKDKLDLALNNSNIGIWSLDLRNNQLEWDERIGSMLGLERMDGFDSLENFEKHIWDEDVPHFKRAIEKAVSESTTIDTIFRAKYNGSMNYIEAKGRVERDIHNNPLKITGVCLDITGMKEATDKTLFALNEDLLRSNKELEQFAYVASHDLQEPLRMVSSFTQLLSSRYKDKLDDQAMEFIGFAVDGAKRMQQLINDLLQYSRIKTRGKSLSLINMNHVLSETQRILSVRITEKEAEISSDNLPHVYADEGQMIQVLQNLIENGLKFCNKKPVIHISVSEEPEFFRFSVKDNGIGIEPQYNERIFQIFQRLHLKDEYGGTGIGLAVCQRIIERHGGKIWVESSDSQGTVFCFTIRKSSLHP